MQVHISAQKQETSAYQWVGRLDQYKKYKYSNIKKNPFITIAVLRTLRLKFSVMYNLNITCSFKQDLPQPETQGSFTRAFTVCQDINT